MGICYPFSSTIACSLQNILKEKLHIHQKYVIKQFEKPNFRGEIGKKIPQKSKFYPQNCFTEWFGHK